MAATPALHLRMAADLAALEATRLRARQFMRQHHVDDHAVAGVELVLEETVTNTLRHGYGPAGREGEPIEIDLQIGPTAVQLLIADDAPPFDPLAVAESALPVTLDQAQVGGLGLLMIRRTASSAGYERSGGRNRLTLSISRS